MFTLFNGRNSAIKSHRLLFKNSGHKRKKSGRSRQLCTLLLVEIAIELYISRVDYDI